MRSDSENGEDDSSHLERRSYIKLTGAVIGGSVLGTTQAGRASAKTRHGITFNNVVDAVKDLGCDPNGNGDVTSKVESALDGQTLVEFPAGTYHWGGSITADTDRIGIRGKNDNVTFTFPSNYNEFFINTTCNKALFENFDVDVRANQTATGIRINSERGFHAENIEHIGRAIVDSSDVTRCWQLRVNDPNSTGVLKDFVAKKGSAWAHYKSGDGRAGISVYGGKGTVKIVDCHLEEFGNNGIYGSRTLSSVQVIGGTYRNNNVCGIRISGEGSYVDGATVEVNPQKYSGPHTLEDDAFTMRGVLFEQGNASSATGGNFDEAGAKVRNTDITIENNPTSGPGIAVWTGGRTLKVKNTRITYNNDGAPAIRREKQVSQGRHGPSPNPRWLRMDRVKITGSAASGPSVLVGQGNGSQIKNSYIEQSGSGRKGIVFSNSDNTLVKNTTIKTPGKSVQLKSSSGKTINVSNSGSAPSLDLSSSGSGSGAGSKSASKKNKSKSKNESGSSSDSSQGLLSKMTNLLVGSASGAGANATTENGASGADTHTLEIKGNGSKANYTFAVDGTLQPNEDPGSFDCTSETLVGENWSSGAVSNSSDKFLFTGSVTSFSTDGNLTVQVDGQAVDPNALGTEGDKQHTLIIDGSNSNGASKYALSVNGSLEKGTFAESDDTVSGSTARGTVSDRRDSFRFSGQITELDVDGDAAISFGQQ
ncbi:hypothetical protein [Halocatena pleomorpha]|uniref:Right-handed parallel beta-helix repeat-containing protein n=1 Tax=Halocatena pleomorpha TaxID=1785090 RepID=A0A3P3RJY9_9EURY|nr:hypothetical protein [Halocatena pleomorpha]RRJ33644.1 hypothetical protein EIK79_02265 [Halocatena pleomorpha]